MSRSNRTVLVRRERFCDIAATWSTLGEILTREPRADNASVPVKKYTGEYRARNTLSPTSIFRTATPLGEKKRDGIASAAHIGTQFGRPRTRATKVRMKRISPKINGERCTRYNRYTRRKDINDPSSPPQTPHKKLGFPAATIRVKYARSLPLDLNIASTKRVVPHHKSVFKKYIDPTSCVGMDAHHPSNGFRKRYEITNK
jgi:hypothetical protein